MDKHKSLLPWWRKEREKIRAVLQEKQKKSTLTDVEKMTLNPLSLQQARKQVQMLNGLVNPQDSDRNTAEV